MRLNKYLAQATGISRRAADATIENGRVTVNNQPAAVGVDVTASDEVCLDGHLVEAQTEIMTIMLNKPVGYVVSRDGQGNQTIYDLLPPEYHHLKAVGRLDKHSSGLLLLTNDGDLAQRLTHPKFEKTKRYKVRLDKELSLMDYETITRHGVTLEDGVSRFELDAIHNQRQEWKVTMYEGRNRQIRRTFEALGYEVKKLHRTHFGDYILGSLSIGQFAIIASESRLPESSG